MKLTLKLVVALCIGIILVFSVEGVLRVRRQLQLFDSDMRRDHLSMGRTFAVAVAEVIKDEQDVDVLTFVDRVNRRHVSTEIRWVNLGAEGMDERCPLTEDLCVRLLEGQEIHEVVDDGYGSHFLHTYVPVVPNDVPVGALELSESYQHQKQFVRATIARTVAATSITVVLCSVIALGLGTIIVGRPVRALVAKARSVGSGQFDGALDLHQHDEIGELASEMNSMSKKLAASHANLEEETAARIRTLEQLRHADRLTTVGKMASGIAHELGTPLNVVSGRASMIVSGEVEGAEARASAGIIVEQTERITSIIRQLLDFARRGETKRSPVDLRRLAAQTVALLAPMARKRNVTLTMGEGEGEALHEVDPGQIQQVLMNVVLNGIHATSSGGKVTISTEIIRGLVPPTSRKPGRYFIYTVTDEGEGITDEDRDHVFDPFFTTKPVGDGTGLGLSVAHGIVVDHGGWIDFQSVAGHGCTFKIHLPVEE